MAVEDAYLDLKRRFDAAVREQDRAAGVADRLLAELKEKYGCGSEAAVVKKAAALEAEVAALRQKLTVGLAKYEEQWERKTGKQL